MRYFTLLALAFVFGCGGNGSGSSQPLAGNWTGTMEPGGSLAVTLSETGRIDGAMDKAGEVGDVDGSLGGDFLRLRIDFPTSPDVDFFAYRPDLQTDSRSIRANVNGTLVDLSRD